MLMGEAWPGCCAISTHNLREARTKAIKPSDGSARSLAYDERGNVVCVEDAFGGKTRYT